MTTLNRARRPQGPLPWAKSWRGFELRRFLDFRRVGLCACCCATLASTARAQQPQSDTQTTSRPATPAEPQTPQTPSVFVPEVLPIGSDVEASTSGWRSVLATVNKDIEGPALRAGSVVSGGGFAIGAHWRETISSRARLDTEYLVSIKGYQSALIDLSSQPVANGRLTFGFGVKYDSLPMEDFFGFGPDSEVGTHTSYERQGLDTRGWARIQVRPWFELRPTIGHLDTRLLAGEQSGIPSIETVAWGQPVSGVARQSRFMHAGLAATIDRRDDAKRTRAGYLIKASAERVRGADAGRFGLPQDRGGRPRLHPDSRPVQAGRVRRSRRRAVDRRHAPRERALLLPAPARWRRAAAGLRDVALRRHAGALRQR